MKSYLTIALSNEVVKTATQVSLVVGTILALINHGNTMLNGELTQENVIKIAVTYLVPYCVSTYSSVKAIHKREPVNS